MRPSRIFRNFPILHRLFTFLQRDARQPEVKFQTARWLIWIICAYHLTAAACRLSLDPLQSF